MNVFDSYSPFIREFIYSRGWQSLSPVQVAAAEIIFGTPDNILLPSQTASGKTEAAFFPILSEFYDDIPSSMTSFSVSPSFAMKPAFPFFIGTATSRLLISKKPSKIRAAFSKSRPNPLKLCS